MKKSKKLKMPPKRRLKIEYVPTKSLRHWGDNPRRNDAAAIELAEKIRVHGLNSALVADREKRIVWKGNTTLKAAKILRLKEVPVTFIDFPTRQQAEDYALADNRSSEWAEWDEDKLAKLFAKRQTLPAAEIERRTGFTQVQLDGLRQQAGLPDRPAGIAAELTPDELEDVDLAGQDNSYQRIILCFTTLAEKRAICKRLGISGAKIRWEFHELRRVALKR